MSRAIMTGLVLFMLANAFLARAVVDGRYATAETLMTRSDAVSYCVRGTASGDFPWLQFGNCLRAALFRAERARLVEQAKAETAKVEAAFAEMRAAQAGFKSWLGDPSPSAGN